jgi:hypothetical protein
MAADNKAFIDNVKRVFSDEYIKRNLIKYFSDKGFDNFNRTIFPPMLQDLPYAVPELVNKVEIVPYVKETNPTTGQVTMGWNLFVFGINRMDLGDSLHNNMNDFQQAINGPTNQQYNAMKSPKNIIDFIMKVLKTSKQGIVHPQVNQTLQPPRPVNRPKMGPSASGGYYEKNRPV